MIRLPPVVCLPGVGRGLLGWAARGAVGRCRDTIGGVSDLIAFGETCTEPGCDGKIHALGLCRKHYGRLRRTGSTADPHPDGRRSPEIADEVGASFRQIDYWARIGLVVPSGGAADGSGTRRGWTDDDVALLRLVVRLRTAGLELSTVETVLDAVANEGLDPDRTAVVIAPDGTLEVGHARP